MKHLDSKSNLKAITEKEDAVKKSQESESPKTQGDASYEEQFERQLKTLEDIGSSLNKLLQTMDQLKDICTAEKMDGVKTEEKKQKLEKALSDNEMKEELEALFNEIPEPTYH